MATVIERRALAPDLDISRVLTGLWQLADMERDGQPLDVARAAAAMAPYADAGLTTFDMADHYGSAEVIAGHFRETRERGVDCQLLTKWVPEPGPVTRDQARAAVLRACERRIDLANPARVGKSPALEGERALPFQVSRLRSESFRVQAQCPSPEAFDVDGRAEERRPIRNGI